MTATGGNPPYSWSSTPAVPATGLTLDSGTGQIRGTSTQSGTFNFTARVIDSVGAIQTQALSLIVGPSASSLTLSIPSLTFFYQLGGVTPQSQIVFLTASGIDAGYVAQSGASWLAVAPASSSTPATLNVSANPASLAAGTYTSSIVITSADSANAPLSLPVTLTVAAASVLTSSPSRLTFPYQIGSAAPPPIPISITSSPSGATVAARWRAWFWGRPRRRCFAIFECRSASCRRSRRPRVGLRPALVRVSRSSRPRSNSVRRRRRTSCR